MDPSSDPHDLPNLDPALFDCPTGARFESAGRSTHPPRFLLLYGSLRERSFSKLLTLEAARLLQAMGAQVQHPRPHSARCRAVNALPNQALAALGASFSADSCSGTSPYDA